jgi:BNR repeat protein
VATFGTEPIPNPMPFGHAPNAIELASGEILVTWYCGSYEGSEDQRITSALKGPDGSWRPGGVVVDRFAYEGDTWIPEIGVPLPTPDGELGLFFWACPLSSFRLVENQGTIRITGGRGGGSWFPYPTVSYEQPIWTRDIPASRLFFSILDSDYEAQTPQPFVEERGLVVMGAARRLQSGRWLLPYHTERKDCWFRTRFFLSDAKQEHWQTTGDIFAEPGCLEPVAVQLSSGDILCYMRRGGFDGHIWSAVSSDECRTFSEPEQTNLRNPHTGIDIGISAVSDRLLVAYNDSYRQRTPLCVGVSDDGGNTFRMRDAESDRGGFAYPKLLQDRDGLWHLFYSYDYRHIQHTWFDEAWLEQGRPVLG